MHDGITFEQTGKRAVVLCTAPFEVTARNIARMMGIPDYPFVILEHPLGSCAPAEVAARATAACEQAIDILTS
ncbi:MAG: hypothetical protein J4F45_13650 [Pseudomonadales bacterium]|nr:hypothetical protein [Pseudomonadales bacterium]